MTNEEVLRYMETNAMLAHGASAPFLRYHTWDHVKAARVALYGLQRMAAVPVPPMLCMMEDVAIMFHDAIHIPGNAQNEAMSALLLEAHVEHLMGQLQLNPILPDRHDEPEAAALLRIILGEAGGLIRRTTLEMHMSIYGPNMIGNSLARILDADICALAFEPDAFDEVQRMVLREAYPGFDKLPQEQQDKLQAGTTGFHQAMYSKPRIFRSPGTGSWEVSALQNLQRYLQRWKR